MTRDYEQRPGTYNPDRSTVRIRNFCWIDVDECDSFRFFRVSIKTGIKLFESILESAIKIDLPIIEYDRSYINLIVHLLPYHF